MRADNFPDPDRPRRRFGLFRSRAEKKGKQGKGRGRAAKPDAGTVKSIEEFIATRVGVEAYLEPETPTNPLSVVFVAADGEWIRKRIPDAAWLSKVSKAARMPVYEVARVGYPRRMREYRRRPPGSPDAPGPTDLPDLPEP
ncbi:MAG TPA: oxidoreductase [Actinomycetota bacterium]|nr:oxidoreductase [Actinomycetota bacterium]